MSSVSWVQAAQKCRLAPTVKSMPKVGPKKQYFYRENVTGWVVASEAIKMGCFLPDATDFCRL
jgi:hypothetical protein